MSEHCGGGGQGLRGLSFFSTVFQGPPIVRCPRHQKVLTRLCMYDDSRPTTAVRCAVGVTEGFEVKVGLHKG